MRLFEIAKYTFFLAGAWAIVQKISFAGFDNNSALNSTSAFNTTQSVMTTMITPISGILPLLIFGIIGTMMYVSGVFRGSDPEPERVVTHKVEETQPKEPEQQPVIENTPIIIPTRWETLDYVLEEDLTCTKK
jgi:hypothetical protein